MNTRRALIIACAGTCAVPASAFAQQARKVRRIGFLLESELAEYAARVEAFESGLRELGYVAGRDYLIERRAASGDKERLHALAVELLALKVDLIVSTGTPSAMAARAATREVPILITGAGSPVGNGLAASLRHPGGNVTGLTDFTTELISKRLDLLRQIVPGLRRVGYLHDPDNPSIALDVRQLQSDCTKLGYTLLQAPVRKGEEIAAAFNALRRDKVQGLLVANPAWFRTWRATIVEEAAKHRLPAVFSSFRSADGGGLITYAVNLHDIYRRVAAYADKIFKGAKAGELPIQLPTRFEVVLNLKTARTMGWKIPPSVMVQATRVIE